MQQVRPGNATHAELASTHGRAAVSYTAENSRASLRTASRDAPRPCRAGCPSTGSAASYGMGWDNENSIVSAGDFGNMYSNHSNQIEQCINCTQKKIKINGDSQQALKQQRTQSANSAPSGRGSATCAARSASRARKVSRGGAGGAVLAAAPSTRDVGRRHRRDSTVADSAAMAPSQLSRAAAGWGGV
jgi:hypothetical protein